MNLEKTLDAAITAVRVAGLRQLGDASVSHADLSDWGWAFTELSAALALVSHGVAQQISRQAKREPDGDVTAVASCQVSDDIYICLIRLAAAFKQAENQASKYSATIDRFAIELNPPTEHNPSENQGPSTAR